MKSTEAKTVAMIGLALVVATGACARTESRARDRQGDTAGAPARPEAAVPGTEPRPAAVVRIEQVELGRRIGADMRVTEPTDTFRPNETIHLVLVPEGSGDTATVRARWTFEDGQVVDESTQTVATTGDNAVHFQIAQPGGLPAGAYKVIITVNGQHLAEKEFKVEGNGVTGAPGGRR